MRARTAHALRWTACLCSLLSVAAVPPARAQSASAPGPPPPPAYEDRLIGGGNLAPDISSGDYYTSDSSGLARAVRIDAVASTLEGEGANTAPTIHENGIVADGQWETSSYGTWSADLGARIGGSTEPFTTPGGDDIASFSVHQRGMPFDGGWQADNGLGDLNTPLINLERQQPRFMFTSGSMLGLETEWRGPSGVQIVAGGGEPGVFEGIKVPTFDTLGGSTATLGAQWSPAPQLAIGAEYAGARDANLYYQPIGSTLLPPYVSNQRISSDTGVVSAAWQQGGDRAQVNLIDGTVDGNGNSLGFWADGSHTQGSYTQSFGAFRIDPNLAWGNQFITNDVEGGYYRLGYQSRRWVADVGVDEVLSVSGQGTNSTFVNGDARYQLTRDSGIGTVANVLLSSDGDHQTAWSLEGYFDDTNAWGTSRLQLDYATNSQTDDVSATVQQSWTPGGGARLATSAAVDRVYTGPTAGLPSQDSTIVRLAAYGGGSLTARLSLDGSVQWATAVQGRAAPSTSADVSLDYQIAQRWSLLFSYYENRVGAWTPLVVTSPLSPPTPAPQASQGQRGIFLTLRFQDARGSHFVPLGGAPGSGSGRLTGVVYLDANENGRFDAGEAAVPNVTVILDGRFSTRTDANGRFDFPAVAAGRHALTVQSDNLPLPWALQNQGRTEVDVTTRDRTDVSIGAVRLK
jgi:SdrD B-like domain